MNDEVIDLSEISRIPPPAAKRAWSAAADGDIVDRSPLRRIVEALRHLAGEPVDVALLGGRKEGLVAYATERWGRDALARALAENAALRAAGAAPGGGAVSRSAPPTQAAQTAQEGPKTAIPESGVIVTAAPPPPDLVETIVADPRFAEAVLAVLRKHFA